MTDGPPDREAGKIASLPVMRGLPGQVPLEAHSVALDRLTEAMLLSATVSRHAAGAYLMALKVAAVSAPYGEHGAAVGKIVAGITKRLEAYLATLPNQPSQPPQGAA